MPKSGGQALNPVMTAKTFADWLVGAGLLNAIMACPASGQQGLCIYAQPESLERQAWRYKQ